jgi:hypothetical protein
MKMGEAYKIFYDIESQEYTDEEKGMAIYRVLKMETHNSVTKDAMLKVIAWLLGMAFELPEVQNENH